MHHQISFKLTCNSTQSSSSLAAVEGSQALDFSVVLDGPGTWKKAQSCSHMRNEETAEDGKTHSNCS